MKARAKTRARTRAKVKVSRYCFWGANELVLKEAIHCGSVIH